jgi:hypothetical protein
VFPRPDFGSGEHPLFIVNVHSYNLVMPGGHRIAPSFFHKMIRSKTIFWDNETRLFKIPGDYICRTAEGETKGNSIAVDLDFIVTEM